VEPIREYRPAASEHPIRRAREPRSERLHARRQRSRARRFDERVNVIAHQRVVHDAKPPAFARLAKRALELGDEPRGAERGDVAPNT